MKKHVMSTLTASLLLVLPTLAYAAGDAPEPEGPLATVLASPIMPNLAEFIPMLLAVSVLLFIMSKYVWPPITKALDEREAKIEGSLRTAEEAKFEAEEILVQYQAKLEEGRKEAAAIVEEGRKAGEAAKADIIARAEETATAIVEKARVDAEAKEKTAAAALQERTAALAVEIASKILGEKLGAEDQARAEELAKSGG